MRHSTYVIPDTEDLRGYALARLCYALDALGAEWVAVMGTSIRTAFVTPTEADTDTVARAIGDTLARHGHYVPVTVRAGENF